MKQKHYIKYNLWIKKKLNNILKIDLNKQKKKKIAKKKFNKFKKMKKWNKRI